MPGSGWGGCVRAQARLCSSVVGDGERLQGFRPTGEAARMSMVFALLLTLLFFVLQPGRASKSSRRCDLRLSHALLGYCPLLGVVDGIEARVCVESSL